jgi:hypothetical protein
VANPQPGLPASVCELWARRHERRDGVPWCGVADSSEGVRRADCSLGMRADGSRDVYYTSEESLQYCD